MTKLVIGINDLESWATKNEPSILEEWCTDINKEELGLEIDKVHYSSHKKAYFKCKFCNEIDLYNISDRSLKHSRCGLCANANQTSYPEQLVYNIFKFIENDTVSQYELCGYKYDVCIEKLKICIEYNSYWTHLHYGNNTEAKKKNICEDNGFKLITICDYNIEDTIKYDIETDTYYYKENSNKLDNIYKICKAILSKYGYIVNISEHKLIELSLISKEKSLNKRSVKVSLLDKVPSIVNEWDYENNGDIRPEHVTYGSTQKYWFKCKNGHRYLAAPKYKSSKNPTGCKRCHDTRVRNSKLITEHYPSLAIEYDLDNDVNIHNITYGCTQEVKWTCPNCGYKFVTTPNSRTYGKYGCKQCGYNWYKLINKIPQKLKLGYKLNLNRIKEIYYERKSAGYVE